MEKKSEYIVLIFFTYHPQIILICQTVPAKQITYLLSTSGFGLMEVLFPVGGDWGGGGDGEERIQRGAGQRI